MVAAVKLVSIRRGYDPRDFALMAFGGGGGLHAAAIAAELKIGRVVIPPHPGTFSALGMLIAEPRHDMVRTRVLDFGPESKADVETLFAEMEAEGREVMRASGFAADDVTLDRRVDLRYVGQEHTVGVPYHDGGSPSLREAFEQAHESKYTFRLDSGLEYVNFHLSVRALRPSFDLRGPTGDSDDPDAAVKGTRPVWFEAGPASATVLERGAMPPDRRWDGPAIVEEPSATTVVPPGVTVHADGHGNLHLALGGGAQ
jgi:N-methylhydantoinase A